MKLLLLLLVALAHALVARDVTEYSWWGRYVATPSTTFEGVYLESETQLAFCAFFLGHDARTALTCADSKCSARSGGVSIFSGSYTVPEINVTIFSSVAPRFAIGVVYGDQYQQLPASVLRMCDISVASVVATSRRSRGATSAKRFARSSAQSNQSAHVAAGPLANDSGDSVGMIGISSNDPSQLAYAVQLFPYANVRRAVVSTVFCASKASYCDACSAPISNTLSSTDPILLIPYSGPSGNPNLTYCGETTLTDAATGEKSVFGAHVIGPAAQVKKVLGMAGA